VKIARLSGCKNFVSERKKFIFDAIFCYIYFLFFLTLISIFCICHALVNKVVC